MPGQVPVDGLLGTAGLAEGLQGLGLLPEEGPERLFLEVLGEKEVLPGAITGGFSPSDSYGPGRVLKVLSRLYSQERRMAGSPCFTVF